MTPQDLINKLNRDIYALDAETTELCLQLAENNIEANYIRREKGRAQELFNQLTKILQEGILENEPTN